MIKASDALDNALTYIGSENGQKKIGNIVLKSYNGKVNIFLEDGMFKYVAGNVDSKNKTKLEASEVEAILAKVNEAANAEVKQSAPSAAPISSTSGDSK